MPSLRARLIDRNRYAKRYPLIRAPKRLTFLGDNELAIEVGNVSFNNTDSARLLFEVPFDSLVGVQFLATARSTADQGNVNIFVDYTSLDGKGVTIKASAPFTGTVDIIAIKVGDGR